MLNLRSHIHVTFALVLNLYLIPNLAQAQYFTGAVASSMGGAGAAAFDQSESPLLNPATVVHGKEISFGGFYFDGERSRGDYDHVLGLLALDNHESSLFPASVAYLRRRRNISGLPSASEQYIQISTGGFVFGQWAIGGTVAYLQTDVDNGETIDQWNGVVGLHYSPLPTLGFAMVYYNPANATSELPQHLELVPGLRVGVNYQFNEFFGFRFDVTNVDRNNPDRELVYQGGLETAMGRFMVLRLGFEENRWLDRSTLTAGLSFEGPKFKLDYYFGQRQADGDSAMHGVDLRVPF